MGKIFRNDPTPLAHFASQASISILDDRNLFSKIKADHSVELIQLDFRSSRDYKKIVFKDAAQLTTHFQDSEPDTDHCHSPVEI